MTKGSTNFLYYIKKPKSYWNWEDLQKSLELEISPIVLESQHCVNLKTSNKPRRNNKSMWFLQLEANQNFKIC